MKLTKWFYISLAIMAVLFLISTTSFTYDGSDIGWKKGFPLVYETGGAFCPPDFSCGFFSIVNLITDLIIMLAIVPFVVNFVALKLTKKK